MQVHEIMSKEVITIDSEDTIFDACKRLYRHKIGSLLVLEEGKIMGIITERDIIAKVIIQNKNPVNTTVKEIMSPQIVTIKQDASIEDAVEIMNSKEIKKLPVVSDYGTLVGIITTSDVSYKRKEYQKAA